jgi:hypothetical protein
MDEMVNLDEFLSQAGDRPCVGVHAETPGSLAVPASIEVRIIDGARTNTLYALFDAFAEVWHFPPRFAQHHNNDAFDDWMRDFDNLTNPALDKPPATGYLTEITNAHSLLVEQPEAFSWFANSIPFYRDSYRDEADPPAAFGLLRSTPASKLNEVRTRWVSVGIQVATITV